MIRSCFLLLFLLFIATGCVQNKGGKYELFIELNQKIINFDDPASYTFNSNDISIQNGQANIQENYSVVDDFSDDSHAGVWTDVDLDGGTTVTLNEQNGRLEFSCVGGFGGAILTNPMNLTDHIAYVEITHTNFASGIFTMIGRVSAANELYFAARQGGSLDLLTRNAAGNLANIGSAATIPAFVNETYAQKLKFDGNQIYYRVWNKSDPEPSTWQLSAVNATYASGNFGVSCWNTSGYWDNARVYDVDSERDYEITNPSFEFPEYTADDKLTQWLKLEIDADISGNDQIKFDISEDGGNTFLTYQSGSWSENVSGYSGAMTVSEINTYFKSFPTDSTSIILRAYLHSEDGTTTPVIREVTFTYATHL